MSLPHSLTRQAEADLDDAYWWYELQKVGRGDDFLVEFNSRVSDIDSNPFQFPLVKRNRRAALMNNSKFIIYYRVESKVFVITAIQHASANPKKWKKRK